jgi:hypothetical protein
MVSRNHSTHSHSHDVPAAYGLRSALQTVSRPTRACSRPPTVPRVEGFGACIAPLGGVHLPSVALLPVVVRAFQSCLVCVVISCVTADG